VDRGVGYAYHAHRERRPDALLLRWGSCDWHNNDSLSVEELPTLRAVWGEPFIGLLLSPARDGPIPECGAFAFDNLPPSRRPSAMREREAGFA
jgi:hypothetical protein